MKRAKDPRVGRWFLLYSTWGVPSNLQRTLRAAAAKRDKRRFDDEGSEVVLAQCIKVTSKSLYFRLSGSGKAHRGPVEGFGKKRGCRTRALAISKAKRKKLEIYETDIRKWKISKEETKTITRTAYRQGRPAEDPVSTSVSFCVEIPPVRS